MKKTTLYLNGRYLRCSAELPDVFTPGVFNAPGVFETMLAVGTKTFDCTAHLKRLKAAMPQATLTPSVIRRVVAANGFEMARVRVMVWKEGSTLHQAVMALEYHPPQKSVYKTCFIRTARKANSRQANIKSLNYALFAEAYAEARAHGFDEAILLNERGDVFEASRANVFAMIEGTLITPPLSSGCLNGITRQQVIAQAARMGIKVVQKALKPKDLASASDVFLTNSLIGIKPVKISSIVLPL